MSKSKPNPGPAIRCSHSRLVPLAELKPNPANPHQHPPEQIRLLAKIIASTGWRAPIVVSNQSGLIVRGHGRFAAAQAAKLTHAPVDFQDYATPQQETADLLADNQLAELAKIDAKQRDRLLADLRELGEDVELAGFPVEELRDIDGSADLVALAVPRPPRFAWALIGIPIENFGRVQTFLDTLPEGTVIQTTANDGPKA